MIDQIIEDSKPILDIIEDVPSATTDKAHEEAGEAQGEQSNEEANEPDMANPDTWLKVPTDKPLIVGVPSRTKPRERGKKSLCDF